MIPEDLGGITIRCKDCGKKLMLICNITRFGDNTPSHFVTATCPFCGGSSLETEIRGTFKVGPVPEIGEDGQPNQYSTVISKIEQIDDTHSTFHIIRRK